MIKNGLTPIGLSHPANTMQSFQDAGNDMLTKIRDIVISPHTKKHARHWGIVDAAKMIGITAPTLRKLESDNSKVGSPERDDNNRRIYSLARINKIRDIIGTRVKRPEGSDPMVIAIANFKGGSAKTTTTVHLAQKCALEGLRVLIVDFDPQGSSTFVAGSLIPDLELDFDNTIYASLLVTSSDIKRVIRQTHFDGLDIVPANLALQDIELSLPNPKINNQSELGSPANRLNLALEGIKDNYDVILIDCGPNLGVLTINALIAANGLIVPIPPNMFDYASFIMLTGTLKKLFNSLGNKSYELFRVLLSKHSGSNEAMQVENMMRTQFGGYVLGAYMCATVEIEKSTNDLSSIYDITKPRGSKEAYRRAMHHLNEVNNEFIGYFKQIWEAQSNSSTKNQETKIKESML